MNAFSDPRDALVDARSDAETSPRADMHRTACGAYVVHRELVTGLARHHPMTPVAVKSRRRHPCRSVGDLGVRLDPERDEVAEDMHPSHRATVELFDSGWSDGGQTDIDETDDPAKPCCIPVASD